MDALTSDVLLDEASDLRKHIHGPEHFEDHALYCESAATMLESLAGELRGIDAVLARRPALDKPTRRENIEHAISVARRCDEAEAEARHAYDLFPPLLRAVDYALNGPDPDALTVRSYVPLPGRAREVMALLRECRDFIDSLPFAPESLRARLAALPPEHKEG